MWDEVDRYIAENERTEKKGAPLRRIFLDHLKTCDLQPIHATKKMVALESFSGLRMVWEITSPATNFFFPAAAAESLLPAGIAYGKRPWREGEKDGGRHSGLGREWSFRGRDAIVVEIPSRAALATLTEAVLPSAGTIRLDPAAVDRWVAALRAHFPGFCRFDGANGGFDEEEREYKLATAEQMRGALDSDDPDTRIGRLIEALRGSNLLNWRVTAPLLPSGTADRQRLGPALLRMAEVATGRPDGHADGLAEFVAVWNGSVPDDQTDYARQVGEMLLMHLAPAKGIFIRHTVREDLWREAVGIRFPADADIAAIYRRELEFMHAVRDAFATRGLAPRDMIDVQGALWVAHRHASNDPAIAPGRSGERIEENRMPRKPTNLILYGPPGTGKTYRTALEAVRLCLGEEAARQFDGPEGRPRLMEAYRKLHGEGRIEFVTFHQSFSYEEFVEGLRPVTERDSPADESAEIPASGGFSLKPHPGVFQRFSERARLDTGDTDSEPRLDRSRPVFKIALGQRGSDEDRIRFGLDNGLIHLGWGQDIDWSDERFEDWSEIHRELEAHTGETVSGHAGDLVCTYSFRNDMQLGDYVVVSDGRDRIRACGKITGEYFFDQGASFHPHRRRVDWIWRNDDGAERALFYHNYFRRHSVYKLDSESIDWDGLESIVLRRDAVQPSAASRDFVLIVDEINRGNISKVFGELITLLEPDKRLGAANEIRLRLPYSGKQFGVPANLHLIGTMNTADRSIALLDTALRRRFVFRELMPDATLLPDDLDGIDLQNLLETLNARIEYLFDREHQIGHAYFMGCQSRKDVDKVMRDNVIPLLAEYFHEDWSKVAAVLEGRAAGSDSDQDGRFLRATRLVAPGDLDEDGDTDSRLRWTVKESFDFSEFAAR